MNNKPYVSKKTAKRIAKSIDELGYKPSAIARNLTAKDTRTIRIIIRDITNPFYNGIVRGMQRYIDDNNLNYFLLIKDLNNDESKIEEFIDYFIENRVVGIISTSNKIGPGKVKNLEKNKIYMSLVSRYHEEPDYVLDYVITDNFKGAYILTKYLLDCGHKNIGFLSGPLNTQTLIDRRDCYTKAR